MDYEKLNKPPIIEVVVGVLLSKPIHSVEKLESLYDSHFSKTFAKKEERKNIKASINIKAGVLDYADTPIGLQLSTEPKDLTLFLETNRLSLSKLAPYETGEDLLKTYKNLWEIFIKDYDGEIKFNDIGLRYINKFTLPANRLEEFSIKPVLASKNRVLFGKYVGQYTILSERYAARAIINVVMEPKENNNVDIMLDIDTHNVNGTKYNNFESDIKNVILRLKDFKNDLFFLKFT